MTQYDYLNYFARSQTITGLALVVLAKSIPLQDVTPRRQVGVGRPVYVEVYGNVDATGFAPGGVITTSLLTKTTEDVTGGTVLMTVQSPFGGVANSSGLLAQFLLPLTGLLPFIGLAVQAATTDPAAHLGVTAFLCDTPSAFTQYDSALIVK